jgi:hypothetical protein
MVEERSRMEISPREKETRRVVEEGTHRRLRRESSQTRDVEREERLLLEKLTRWQASD